MEPHDRVGFACPYALDAILSPGVREIMVKEIDVTASSHHWVGELVTGAP
jgi:hypothetical protein